MSDKKSKQTMNSLKGFDGQQISKDQNKQNSQQQQFQQRQNSAESNMKIEDENRIDQQKQQQLILMKNQLLSKFRNILDNIYSSNIQHNEQIEKELNELSQILEMPMDSLISAMKNVQSQYSPSQEKQELPLFLRELDSLDKQEQYKNEKVQNKLQDDNQIQQQMNLQQQQYLKNQQILQKQQVITMVGQQTNQSNSNILNGNYANESNENKFYSQQQSKNPPINQPPANPNIPQISNRQRQGQNNRFLQDNPELANTNEQFYSTPNNNLGNSMMNTSNTQDVLQKSNEFFSFATQSRKANFFLQDLDFISTDTSQQNQQQYQQLINQDKGNNSNRYQQDKNGLLQQAMGQNNKSNTDLNSFQSPTASSVQRIKQMQLSPFQYKQNPQNQSYISQYQLKKDQLGKRNNSNSTRDEDIMRELNKIQQTQQQREDSAEGRQQNKQLRLLQILSKSSPERQQQYIQEKQRYQQLEEMNDRVPRSNSKDSESSENSQKFKKIINIHPAINISLSPEQLESFQESPINSKTQRAYQGNSDDLIKSMNSQRSPLNVSKSNFVFPQTSKSNSDKPLLQQYFSSQQKTLQLIETHQELDELRKKIDDLNIEICNKDIEIIDLSTKLRDQKNQQLTLTYKMQQENKQFEQVKQSLSETKYNINSEIRQYLEVLQDIQASENSSYSLRSKTVKKVRNSQLLSERSLKNSARLSKIEVSSFDNGYNKINLKEDSTLKVESGNKTKIGGLPSSSTFSEGKANNNKSILEDEEEDQLSEDQSIDINRTLQEQDEILSNQVLEETDSYFIQYVQTQKLLNAQLQSLQSNESHKLKMQQLSQEITNFKQDNQRLTEQINQMASMLKGMNNMQEQEKEIELYMQKLEQEKKSLELTLDELNRHITRKKNELIKAREQLQSKLTKVKQGKEEAALEHNQIISKNQIKIQELQKKKNQVYQKLESELNQQRKELRSKVSLNNFEKSNLENDIKKKQDILNAFGLQQQTSIKPQVEKIQSELQILQQTNKLLRKDIENKKDQLEQFNSYEDIEDDENENNNANKSQYSVELQKIRSAQKKLKIELQQEKEKLQLEKSFSNNQNEEFIVQAEQKLNYHQGLKTQLEKLNQEIEQLEAKKEQCLRVQQSIELTINNSKTDINLHDQQTQQIKQLKESNQIIINKINQMNTILKEKKNISAKQEDEIENKLRPQLEQTIILISDLNMEEQELIQKRKELKNLLS